MFWDISTFYILKVGVG